MQWECDFVQGNFADHPEMKTHPIVQHSPLDALYGGRTEAMRLSHKAREGATIQYVDVMSLYPYVCKFSEFPISHPVIHVGDSCQDMETMLLKDGLMKCSILPLRHYTIMPPISLQ